MPDNRPLFDDDDLPDWMKDAGITPATPSNTPAAASPGDDLLDWMQPAEPANAPDVPPPDFGDLDWDTPSASPAMPAAPGNPPATGLTGMLPWRQGVSDAANEPPIPEGTDVGWLDSPQAQSDPALLSDTHPGFQVDWNEAKADQKTEPLKPIAPPSPVVPPVMPPPGSASDAPRGLKKRVKPEPPPAAPTPAPPVQPAVPDNLTYEEWERRQNEQEAAATRDPNEALLESVPDWFASAPAAPAIPPDQPAAKAPEFMPDWFAGADEQASDAVPDWFNAGPPADASHVPAPVSEPASDLPDWMQPSGAGSTEPAAATDDALDWMADFMAELPPDQAPADQGDAVQPAVPSQAAPAPADVPDWMRAMAPQETPRPEDAVLNRLPPTPPGAPAKGEASASAGDVPEWLRDMAPIASDPSLETSSSTMGAESVQDWFAESSAAAESTEPANALSPGELPDWLSSVQPGTPGAPRSQPAASLDLKKNITSSDIDALLNAPSSQALSVPPKPAIEASAALDDFDLDTILGPAPVEATPEPTAPEPAVPAAPALPPPGKTPGGILRRLPTQGQPLPAAAKPAVPLPAASAAAPGLTRSEVPEFIKELRSGPVSLNVGENRVELNEAPLNQLTDQLKQLRERSRQVAPDAPSAASSASGPLADVSEALVAEPLIGKVAAQTTLPAQIVVSDLQARRVKLVQTLLEIEGTDAPADKAATAKARARVRVKLDRLLITAVLLLGLVAPFFTDVLNLVALPDTTQPTAAQTAVFNAIDGLTAGKPVLVAFEYGPTGAGELDDMARALLSDLIKKGAKPVIVSTNPAGALHAESLLTVFGHDAATLTALNRTDKPLTARVDYVVLRYLPAGAAGVRSVFNAITQGGFQAQSDFLTDIEGQPSGLSLDADVPALANAPAIVLAETPEDVRNWAEQYRAPSAGASASSLRIILTAAAAADATARAYSASLPGTLIGPLIGLRDATVYRARRQPPAKASDAKALDQRWQSTGLGALLAGVIIFLGSMLSLIQAVRRRGANR